SRPSRRRTLSPPIPLRLHRRICRPGTCCRDLLASIPGNLSIIASAAPQAPHPWLARPDRRQGRWVPATTEKVAAAAAATTTPRRDRNDLSRVWLACCRRLTLSKGHRRRRDERRYKRGNESDFARPGDRPRRAADRRCRPR